MSDAPTRSDFAHNMFAVRSPFAADAIAATKPGSAIANAEQQRAIAEVQARMLIARANPRDQMRAMDAILRDCTRPSLASQALYQYGKGGSSISGPSIRLAEAVAQRWGNIASGIKEVSRSGGYSECVAYAWDLESGYYDERQFQVRHWIDTRSGGRPLNDEREIYELIANMGQRRKRAVLLTVIPGDVIEAAVEQCEATLSATADNSPEALKKIEEAFAGFGVTKAQIEKRCQCHFHAIRPAQIVQLRKIYASMKDGMSDPKDWFEATMWTAEQGTGAQAKGFAPTPPAQPSAAAPAKTATFETSKEAHTPRKRQASAPEPTPPPQEAPQDDGVPFGRWEQENVRSSMSQEQRAPAFSQWLVDAEGEPIQERGADLEAYTDAVRWMRAYLTRLADEPKDSRELYLRANVDARDAACLISKEAVELLHAAEQPTATAASAPVAAQAPETAPAAPHWLIPLWTKPNLAAFEQYAKDAQSIIDKARTVEDVQRIADLNNQNYTMLPPKQRLAIKAMLEAARKRVDPLQTGPGTAAPQAEPAASADDESPAVIAKRMTDNITDLPTSAAIGDWLRYPQNENDIKALEHLSPSHAKQVTDYAASRRRDLRINEERERVNGLPIAEVLTLMSQAISRAGSLDDLRSLDRDLGFLAGGQRLMKESPTDYAAVQTLYRDRQAALSQ